MASSPHSTPIGAKFSVPSSAIVVTIVSTIIKGSSHQVDRRRHKRAVRVAVPRHRFARPVHAVPAVGAGRQLSGPRPIAVQETIEQCVAILGGRRFRVELYADNGMLAMLDRHD